MGREEELTKFISTFIFKAQKRIKKLCRLNERSLWRRVAILLENRAIMALRLSNVICLATELFVK